jgi:hypothetical protein
MINLEKRILEELIYERIRVSINLCQLVIFESDLEKSIERALMKYPGTAYQRGALARELVDDAWSRVEGEWEKLRDNLAGHINCDDCDHCQAEEH